MGDLIDDHLLGGVVGEEPVAQLAGHSRRAARRAGELGPTGIHYVDVGTSGGVLGLDRGYCLMIGGDAAVVDRLDPIFATLAKIWSSAPC